jgi:hypothetical protein
MKESNILLESQSGFLSGKTVPVIINNGRPRLASWMKWTVALSVLFGVVGIAVGTYGIIQWQGLQKEVDRLRGQVDELAIHNAALEATSNDLKLQARIVARVFCTSVIARPLVIRIVYY